MNNRSINLSQDGYEAHSGRGAELTDEWVRLQGVDLSDERGWELGQVALFADFVQRVGSVGTSHPALRLPCTAKEMFERIVLAAYVRGYVDGRNKE